MVEVVVGYSDECPKHVQDIFKMGDGGFAQCIELSKGRIDKATQLAEKVASELQGLTSRETQFSPVIVASKHGNLETMHRFSASFKEGRPSPVAYSASGYNIIAQAAARGFKSSGSSLVLAGESSSLYRAVMLTALRMRFTNSSTGLALASYSWSIPDNKYANVAIGVLLDLPEALDAVDRSFLSAPHPSGSSVDSQIKTDFNYVINYFVNPKEVNNDK